MGTLCAHTEVSNLEINLAYCKQVLVLVRSEVGTYTYLYGKPLVVLNNLNVLYIVPFWVNIGAIWKREELREVRQDCGTCEELGASQERHGPYLPTFKVTMRKRMGYSY